MKILTLIINHRISKDTSNGYVICNNFDDNFPSTYQQENKASFKNQLGTIWCIVNNYLF